MNLNKYQAFIFLSIFQIIFVTPAFAKPVINLSDKPALDHAWRKSEIVPLPTQARSFEKDPFSDPFSLPYKSSDNGIWYDPGTNPRVFQEVDVLHYTIDAIFDLGDPPYPDNANLEAEVAINAQAKAIPLTEVVVDLFDNITIDSLQLNGELLTLSDNYTRSDNKIWITLSDNKTIAPLEDFEIIVNYHRVYGGAFAGIGFKTHGVSNTPVIYSLSQPYIAPMWRPCFDVPSDKATADIYITCPDWMTTTSNGSLQPGYPIDNGDGTITALWKENYPIYTSVLSVAMTDYTAWSDTYVSPLDNSTMPLNYFAFPEDSAKAMDDFTINKDALEIFAQTYGEYPFINEKYGVVETPNKFGSLENQTLTSLTITATQSSANWDVIVHELAHQWWGDALTCDTWNHVWLHEGFATYSEIIFYEQYTGGPPGPFIALEYDDGLYNGDLAATVYCEDENLNNPFMQTGSIYEKGAWVLHMLRHIMGDASFFSTLSSYYQEHIHSTVVTNDFKTAAEYEYGASLDDFFNEWLYTPYRPVYSILYENSSRSGGYLVDIRLEQTQGHSVVDISGNILRDYYIMPVDFTVHYKDQTKETFTVNNNQRSQHFQLLTTKEPDYTVFDEDKNILKVVYAETADNDGILNDGDNSSIIGDNTCAAGNTDNCDDNCPDTPNGFDLGTCSMTITGITYGTGVLCTDNSTCGSGICQMAQEDYNGNGAGDVCECYANLNTDSSVNIFDLIILKNEYNSSGCSELNPCQADINGDGQVSIFDLIIMKNQYNKTNCPPIL